MKHGQAGESEREFVGEHLAGKAEDKVAQRTAAVDGETVAQTS